MAPVLAKRTGRSESVVRVPWQITRTANSLFTNSSTPATWRSSLLWGDSVLRVVQPLIIFGEGLERAWREPRQGPQLGKGPREGGS